MIKKVVVSAAGQGTRMLELTKEKSKHLINVLDRPFLAYVLDNIFEAGYREIILVAGFQKELMQNFVDSYTYKGKKYPIEVISQFEILGPKEKEYGTACPLKCVKDLVGNEPFISLVGDNFYTVETLKAMNIDDNYTYVAGLEHDHPERFGVLIENGEFLKEIIEKPKEFVGNLINSSLYKFTSDVFEKLPLITKSPRGEYEITDVVSLLAKDGKVKIKKIKDYWMDFGKPEDVEKITQYLNEGH